jgi:hypothetical protein
MKATDKKRDLPWLNYVSAFRTFRRFWPLPTDAKNLESYAHPRHNTHRVPVESWQTYSTQQ